MKKKLRFLEHLTFSYCTKKEKESNIVITDFLAQQNFILVSYFTI